MASVKMELAIVGDEEIYFDIEDVLDILQDGKLYTIIFQDGEHWHHVKIRKNIYDKFEKHKKKKGQI